MAGNGAVDASAALQDFDGISYAKGCAILRQLNATLGDEVFFNGVIDHFERHRFGNATMHDLFASWERAGAGDLSSFTDNWLRTAGPDLIELDRAAGVVRRTPPADHPADRPHRIRAAVASEDGTWTDHVLELEDPETPFDAGDRPVLLDPYNDTWALLIPDKLTMDALESLLPRITDPELRAGLWSNIRSALHNAAVDPVDVLEVAVRSLPIEDTEDSRRRTMAWVYGWVVPLQPDPAAALARAAHRRARQGGRRRARPRRSSCRRSGPPSARRPTRPSWRRGWPATGCPRASRSTSTCAGGCWPSSPTLGAVDLAELDRQLDGRAHGGGPGPPRRGTRLAARRRGQGLGLGLLHRRDQPAQLRARGGGLGLLARRAGGAHRAVRRALLRRPARHRQGAQRLGAGRRRSRTSSRGPQ